MFKRASLFSCHPEERSDEGPLFESHHPLEKGSLAPLGMTGSGMRARPLCHPEERSDEGPLSKPHRPLETGPSLRSG
jgi:hypothetical protein